MQISLAVLFESLDQFQDYFLRAYSSDQPTLAEQIILLAAWISLFPSCALASTGTPQAAEYQAETAICLESLDVAIARLPFHLPVTFDSILALATAVSSSKITPRVPDLTRLELALCL